MKGRAERSPHERAHAWASRYVARKYPELGEQAGYTSESGAQWWGAYEGYMAAIRQERRRLRGKSNR